MAAAPPPAFGHLTFRQRVFRLKKVLFLIYMLGFVNGVPAPAIPSLQHHTYGENAFLIKGGLAAGKGLLHALYMPLLGAVSDNYGRRPFLCLTFALSSVPYLVYIISGNFWAYTGADLLFGLYAATLCLLMAAVTDFIPKACPVRTESFAITMAFFMLGIGTGPFVGFMTTTGGIFLISAVGQIFTALVALWMLPQFFNANVVTEKPTDETGEQQTEDETSPEPKEEPVRRCPFHKALPDREATETTALVVAAVETPEAAEPQTEYQLYNDDDSAAVNKCPVKHVSVAPEALEGEPIQQTTFRRAVDLLKAEPQLRLLAVIIFWSYTCQEVLQSFVNLYANEQLHFDDNDQIYLISVLAVAGLLCLTVVVTVLKHFFGTLHTMRIAIIGNIAYCLLYAFVRTKWQGLAVPLLGILGNGVFPCTCAWVSRITAQRDAGAGQGVATAVRSIAEGVSPLAFGVLFNATQNFALPGIGFIVGAFCGLIALALTFWIRK